MAKDIRDPAIAELYKIKELCAEKGVDDDIQKRLSDAITLAEVEYVITLVMSPPFYTCPFLLIVEPACGE